MFWMRKVMLPTEEDEKEALALARRLDFALQDFTSAQIWYYDPAKQTLSLWMPHVVRTVSCTWTARTALHPFRKKDHGIPNSLSRKVSERQRRQKIRWNLSSVGCQKRLGGECVFLFKGFWTLLPFFFPFWCWKEQVLDQVAGGHSLKYPATDRQNIFWEAVPDSTCGNATLSLQDIFISILSNHICRYSSQVYLDVLWCFDLVSLFHLGFPVLGEQKAPFQDGLASDKDPVKEIQQFFSDALRQRFNVLP